MADVSIYLDHNATGPVHPEVAEALVPVLRQVYGNPSAVYGVGQDARKAMAEARERVAGLLGADASEIVVTSGGTEANHLAIAGAFFGRRGTRVRHVVVSAIEHPSVLETCFWLQRVHGAEVTVVGVRPDGRVDPDEIEAAAAEYSPGRGDAQTMRPA